MAGSTDIVKAELSPVTDYISHVSSMCSFLSSLDKIKSIILISSGGAVYGEPLYEASKESDSLRPKSIYGKRNAVLETIFASCISQKSIPYTILRVANPYGIDQLLVRRTGLIFSIVRSLIQGRSIRLRGSGLQLRDYIHINDLCEFVLLLFAYGLSSVPNILNVCSGKSYSSYQVADIIMSKLKIDGDLEISEDNYLFEVNKSCINPSLLKNVQNSICCRQDLFLPFEDKIMALDARLLFSCIEHE